MTFLAAVARLFAFFVFPAWLAIFPGAARAIGNTGNIHLPPLPQSPPYLAGGPGVLPPQKFLGTAIKNALDDRLGLQARTNAIQELARHDLDIVAPIFSQLLAPGHSEIVAMTTLRAMNRYENPGVMRIILGQWIGLSAASRSQIVAMAFVHRSRMEALATALRSEEISAIEIDAPTRERLLKDREYGSSLGSVLEGHLARHQQQQTARLQPALSAPGDSLRGREIFLAHCASCHPAHPQNGGVALNWNTLKTKPAEELLSKLLFPSGAVTTNYPAMMIEKKDGQLFYGMPARATATNLVFLMSSGQEWSLWRRDLKALTPLKSSLMPEGLLDILTAEEVANLFAYVHFPGSAVPPSQTKE